MYIKTRIDVVYFDVVMNAYFVIMFNEANYLNLTFCIKRTNLYVGDKYVPKNSSIPKAICKLSPVFTTLKVPFP